MSVMKANETDVKFYSAVTGCPLRCAGIKNAPAEGHSPCGFFALAERSTIVFLLVGADPGPKLSDHPVGCETPESWAREFLENPRFISPEKKKTDFHRDVLGALSEILGVHEPHDLFRHVVYTNVVKCSPIGKTIPFQTKGTCYAHHLKREIEYFEPWAIIAIGSKDFFEKNPPLRVTGEAIPWFPLIHPGSRRYGPERYDATRAEQVDAIRRWYQDRVGKGGNAATVAEQRLVVTATIDNATSGSELPTGTVEVGGYNAGAFDRERAVAIDAKSAPTSSERVSNFFPFPLDAEKLRVALHFAASLPDAEDFFCPTPAVRNWLRDIDEPTLVRAIKVRGPEGYGPLQDELKSYARVHYNNTKAAYANAIALAIWELSRRATERCRGQEMRCVIPTFGEIGSAAASCGFQPPQANWSTTEIVKQFAKGYCGSTCSRGFAVRGAAARRELPAGEKVGIMDLFLTGDSGGN